MSAQPTKTVRRALLEFGLIVLGVLTALGVDEWRAGLEERALERSYLVRLEGDLLSDSAALVSQGFLNFRGTMLDRLSEASGALRSGEMTVDTVAGIIARTTQLGWFFSPPNSATFDELRSTGAFNLIGVRTCERRSRGTTSAGPSVRPRFKPAFPSSQRSPTNLSLEPPIATS